jgi:hypothetical protein
VRGGGGKRREERERRGARNGAESIEAEVSFDGEERENEKEGE